jgi:hypothetical protein
MGLLKKFHPLKFSTTDNFWKEATNGVPVGIARILNEKIGLIDDER